MEKRVFAMCVSWLSVISLHAMDDVQFKRVASAPCFVVPDSPRSITPFSPSARMAHSVSFPRLDVPSRVLTPSAIGKPGIGDCRVIDESHPFSCYTLTRKLFKPDEPVADSKPLAIIIYTRQMYTGVIHTGAIQRLYWADGELDRAEALVLLAIDHCKKSGCQKILARVSAAEKDGEKGKLFKKVGFILSDSTDRSVYDFIKVIPS